AFITGDANNGFFWRGTGQGLIAADYTITIPHIPLTLGGGGLFELPITGHITGLTVQSFMVHGIGDSNTGIPLNLQLNVLGQQTDEIGVHVHIPVIDKNVTIPLPALPISLGITVDNQIGAILVPPITINPITFNNFMVGNNTTSLSADVAGGIGPVTIPVLQLAAAPGFGNSTGVPSSGFFNSGVGGGSGVGNSGSGVSGWWNVGSLSSGYQNLGNLVSGFINKGELLSGINNSNILGLSTSGVGNVGDNVSGLFFQGADRMSIFNAGLANVGVGNVGFGSVGDGNVGGGNVGGSNVGFG
ncbi:hypothetical protein AB3G43_28600, partial [Mycobacterium kansasii]